MDSLGALKVGLKLYATLLGLLALVTLGWSFTSILVLDSVSLATGWFFAAGFGTALLTVLLVRAFPSARLADDWVAGAGRRPRGDD